MQLQSVLISSALAPQYMFLFEDYSWQLLQQGAVQLSLIPLCKSACQSRHDVHCVSLDSLPFPWLQLAASLICAIARDHMLLFTANAHQRSVASSSEICTTDSILAQIPGMVLNLSCCFFFLLFCIGNLMVFAPFATSCQQIMTSWALWHLTFSKGFELKRLVSICKTVLQHLTGSWNVYARWICDVVEHLADNTPPLMLPDISTGADTRSADAPINSLLFCR